jgi:hypothetical protein
MTKGTIAGLAVFVGGIVITLLISSWLEAQPSAPDQKFEVVDTYRGCSVVQYAPTNAARYTYFLDCKK